MEELRRKKGFICDMDGVIYHGNRLLPGGKGICGVAVSGAEKIFCSSPTPPERPLRSCSRSCAAWGLDVDESRFYTSALATARFISSQAPGCSAYVIGARG